MNTPPKQITTAPDGYEWHEDGMYWAVWEQGAWRASDSVFSLPDWPRIRKIKPPTVMVELPREAVEHIAEYWVKGAYWGAGRVARKALEAEEQEGES